MPGFPVLHYLSVCLCSCLLSRWCHLSFSAAAALFFFLLSFPASGSLYLLYTYSQKDLKEPWLDMALLSCDLGHVITIMKVLTFHSVAGISWTFSWESDYPQDTNWLSASGKTGRWKIAWEIRALDKCKGHPVSQWTRVSMQSSKEQQGEMRKPSSVINAKKQRKTIEWERLEISSRKLEIPREYFMHRWAQ